MEGRSKLGSRTPETVEVSVPTISQGCAGAGQRADTPVDRDPTEKNSVYLQMLSRAYAAAIYLRGMK